MGGERIEIDVNRKPSLLVFSVEHADLILVLRSPRRWFGLRGDVHDIKADKIELRPRSLGHQVPRPVDCLARGYERKSEAGRGGPSKTRHREEQKRGARWFHRPAAGKFLEESGCESCETGDRRGILETSLP